MFKGAIRFNCSCGNRYSTIMSLKQHLRKVHLHFNPVYNIRNRFCMPLTRATRRHAPGYYTEHSLDELSLGTHEEVVNDCNPPEYSSMLCPESSSIEEDFVQHSTVPSTFSFTSFNNLLQFNTRLRALTNLYHFCLEAKCSVRVYRKLVELEVIDRSYSLPKQRKDLREIVRGTLEQVSGWITAKTMTLSTYGELHLSPTPYMCVLDCFRIWLSVPVILRAARESMNRYLPDNLIDLAEYDDLIRRREIDIETGIHIYENVADGSEWLPTIRSCVPNFRDAYVKALEDDIEVIVCSLGCYDDSFKRAKDSLINQQLFCLTLRKNLLSS